MSEPATALGGAGFSGIVRVDEVGLFGMVTFRGDLSAEAVASALVDAGYGVPGQGEALTGEEASTLWMSPDELLLVGPYDGAEDLVKTLGAKLDGQHHLAVNVSDARTVFRLTGKGSAIRETLAKLTPADLRPAALPEGRVRRTRVAQSAAAFWFTKEDEAVLVCFRSVAGYVFGLLTNAAEPGSEVGHF